jgi:drug/metabolite transporter (DMT)-like permease
MLIYLKLLLMTVCWGGTFIAGRYIAQDVDPFAGAFLRFASASVLLLFLTRKQEGRWPRIDKRQVFPLILLGMTGVFAYNIFFLKGLKLITAGRASLIVASNPILIALFSVIFLKERLNAVKGFGIILSVAGAVVVISKGHPAEMLAGGLGWGEILILGCVASWVTYSLVGRAVMARLSPLVSVTYASVLGALALLIPACLEGMPGAIPGYSLLDWAGILYLGIFGTVIGFVWYYEGIRAVGPIKAGQFINFVPVSAILLGFFVLDEPITSSLAMGAVLVIGGVYLTNAFFAAKKGRSGR